MAIQPHFHAVKYRSLATATAVAFISDTASRTRPRMETIFKSQCFNVKKVYKISEIITYLELIFIWLNLPLIV